MSQAFIEGISLGDERSPMSYIVGFLVAPIMVDANRITVSCFVFIDV